MEETNNILSVLDGFSNDEKVNAQGICKDGSLLSGEVRAEGEKH